MCGRNCPTTWCRRRSCCPEPAVEPERQDQREALPPPDLATSADTDVAVSPRTAVEARLVQLWSGSSTWHQSGSRTTSSTSEVTRSSSSASSPRSRGSSARRSRWPASSRTRRSGNLLRHSQAGMCRATRPHSSRSSPWDPCRRSSAFIRSAGTFCATTTCRAYSGQTSRSTASRPVVSTTCRCPLMTCARWPPSMSSRSGWFSRGAILPARVLLRWHGRVRDGPTAPSGWPQDRLARHPRPSTRHRRSLSSDRQAGALADVALRPARIPGQARRAATRRRTQAGQVVRGQAASTCHPSGLVASRGRPSTRAGHGGQLCATNIAGDPNLLPLYHREVIAAQYRALTTYTPSPYPGQITVPGRASSRSGARMTR